MCLSYRTARIPLWSPNIEENRPVHNTNFLLNFLRLWILSRASSQDGPASFVQVYKPLTSTSIVTGATLDLQKVLSSTRNGKAIVERKATIKARPAAGLTADRSKLPRHLFSLQGLMEDHNGSDFFPSLYVKLLSQLAGPYTRRHQELRCYM